MGREPFTGYENDPQDILFHYMIEDLNIDETKLHQYVLEEVGTKHHDLVTEGKSLEWIWFQKEIHAKTFHETLRGYDDHMTFEPYHEVIEWIKKTKRDLGAEVVVATARSDHLKDIDFSTEDFIKKFLGDDYAHVSVRPTGNRWVRTLSSGDKPLHLEGIGVWLDDDFRNAKLHSFLRDTGVYIVKRHMPLNAHLPYNGLIMDPRSPEQPALKEMYEYCKENGIKKIGTDIDDTLRPFREYMGFAAQAYAQLNPALVRQLQK